MRGRRLHGLLLALILAAGLNGFAAGPTTNSQALGMLMGRDPAWVNNQPALPGTAFYPGDVITTGKDSTLQMNFRTGVTATLGGNSELALFHEPSAAHLNLRRGSVAINSAAGQSAYVSVGATSVFIESEGGFPAICRIAALGGVTAVANERGRVVVQRVGMPMILPAGKSIRLEAGAPQGGGQQAGKVSAAIPEEVIQRVGQTTETTLKINEGVNWNDVIRTLKTGRVRIELLDGTTMNVGSRSTMRIVKHDPDSQQTEIEMKLGRLRSEVVKLTKPNAKFEVTTSTAVIGVVGTTMEVHALATITYVWCRLGLCHARNLNPLIQGVANMVAGTFTRIPVNGPPSTPVPAVPGQLNAQSQSTSIGGPGAPSPGAGFGFGNAATFGSTAAGAGLAGGAASALSGASAGNEDANAILGDAADAANDASGTAQGASDEAGDVADGANDIEQHLLSPSEPGCNCR
jgi:ferric-dicitrate binding protein FerR (iron transport regulator)